MKRNSVLTEEPLELDEGVLFRVDCDEEFLPDSFFSVLVDRPLDSLLDCASAGIAVNNNPTIKYRGITQRREVFVSVVVIRKSSKIFYMDVAASFVKKNLYKNVPNRFMLIFRANGAI